MYRIVGGLCNPVGMTTGTVDVRVLAEDEIASRRASLLERAGMSLYELRDKAHEYELSLGELEILRELERLEFISGN